jgi:hypothetical protein
MQRCSVSEDKKVLGQITPLFPAPHLRPCLHLDLGGDDACIRMHMHETGTAPN